MQMRKLDYFWKSNKEWWHRDENATPVLNDDAPKEAKESYENFKRQCAESYEDRMGIVK